MVAPIIAQLACTWAMFEHARNPDIKPMETETTVERYGRYLEEINRGFMLSMQAQPSDTTTDCYTAALATNVELNKMFHADSGVYATGELTQGEFFEQFQVMGFKMVEQFDACGVNEILIILDNATNNIPNTIAGLNVIGT